VKRGRTRGDRSASRPSERGKRRGRRPGASPGSDPAGRRSFRFGVSGLIAASRKLSSLGAAIAALRVAIEAVARQRGRAPYLSFS